MNTRKIKCDEKVYFKDEATMLARVKVDAFDAMDSKEKLEAFCDKYKEYIDILEEMVTEERKEREAKYQSNLEASIVKEEPEKDDWLDMSVIEAMTEDEYQEYLEMKIGNPRPDTVRSIIQETVNGYIFLTGKPLLGETNIDEEDEQ